jgi:hypothetical protein
LPSAISKPLPSGKMLRPDQRGQQKQRNHSALSQKQNSDP